MRLVRASRAALLMSVVLLASPFGCGPGASDEPGASTATTTASAPAEGHRNGAPAAAPAAVAKSSSPAAPRPPPEQKLIVPDWMQAALHHPDPTVRLQALDRWAQQGRVGAVEPLMLALSDADERVRARAFQLIEQDWVAEQARDQGR